MVTFVFTDIEGSTRLFRRIGDRYTALLDRHNELVRRAIAAHRGVEVKTEGDAFFVAFADAVDAVEACAHAQRNLAAEPWPADAEVRVRFGVHSGLASPRGADYVAFAVHQAARVVSAGHGGQILVSSETAARTLALETVTLVSLGHFRVRDFDDPLELFQVAGQGLSDHFPSVRALPADRHNLIAPATTLVGRTDELAELATLVDASRLVSVIGPGGLGKTRLAVEHGLAHASDWEHGVWFVDLAPLAEASAVPGAIGGAVSASVGDRGDAWTEVLDHLRDRQALLILDNCEHLTVEIARRVDSLLRSCPLIRVLATSREPLGLQAERIWRPAPLPIDTTGLELFCQRAGIDEPDTATRAAIARLCERLDGLPLAIELAAARADVMTAAEIVARLDSRQALLRSRDPTLSDRQRSLDALIDWSCQLLTPTERSVFRRLGVFAAGFDLEAAAAAVADDTIDVTEVPELVWSLQSRSLVGAEPASSPNRYRMLRTIRAFAAQELDATGEAGEVAVKVGRYYTSRYEPHQSKLDPGAVSDRAREIDNMQNIVSIISTVDPELSQSIASTLVVLTAISSAAAAFDLGLRYLDLLPGATEARLRLLLDTSFVGSDTARADETIVLLDEAEALMREADPSGWTGSRLTQLRGIAALRRGEFDVASAFARAGIERAATPHGRRVLLNLLSMASAELGRYDEARDAERQSLDISQSVGDLLASSLHLGNLAEIALRRGDDVAAARHQLESLTLAVEFGHGISVGFAIAIAARLAAARELWGTAVRLQVASDAVLAGAGYALRPSDRALGDEVSRVAASHLGPAFLRDAAESGAGLPIEAAAREAEQLLSSIAATV